MLKKIGVSGLSSMLDTGCSAILNNSEQIKRRIGFLFYLSAAVASALFFLWLVGTAEVVYLDGIFAALACALGSLIAVFRITEVVDEWPVSILPSKAASRERSLGALRA